MDFLLLLDFLGFYGPIILIVINIMMMWSDGRSPSNRWYYILLFLLGAGLDNYINHILKHIMKEPRPEKCQPSVFDPCTGVTPDYGMPSGHAESAVYCWTFMWLMNPKLSWSTGFGAFLVMMTWLHRYVYNRHTIEQLFVGSFLGGLTAIGIYCIGTNWNLRLVSP